MTDDDTNVSECCENILQDLGAMIRKSYTDTVTHLIFKNGSPTTFNKAKSKGKHIVNLLWVTHCQEKNERVPEDKYKISIAPQKLIGSKRRKTSMEPGRVKALFGNDGLLTNNGSSQEEVRRRTILTTDWVAKSLEGGKNKASSRESELRKRYIEELEKEEEEEAGREDSLSRLEEENELVVLPPRLSLPVSAEMIANRHISKKRRSNINDIIPVEPPSKEAQEQIKARFSIGDKNVINSNSGTTNSNQNMIPTSFNQSVSSTSSTTATNSNNVIPVELPQIPQINNSGIRRRRLKVYTQATPSSPSSSSSRAITNNDKLQQPHSRQLQPQQPQQQPLALKVSIGRLPSSKAGNNRK
ncbi:MAG: hypothetical protein EXX96DRAFT_202327 [Benjaminiella poitrasii]|nr:MAG: hypothetical protein EXX96DRAFT_202327 [Benjaminiella poitrasii]